MIKKQLEGLLPLTEAMYYILLALVEPKHGYGVIKELEKMTSGRIRMGPGTLYGVLSKLEKQQLIRMLSEADQRKTYGLTEDGRLLLRLEWNRLKELFEHGAALLTPPEKEEIT